MNMSYCRFENTLEDLRDCARSMNDGESDDLSEIEERSRNELIRLCIEIAKYYGPDDVSNALFDLKGGS